MINNLIYSGFNINDDNNNNYYKSYIHKALLNKNYYIVSILISKCAKVNYKFNSFERSLIYEIMYIKPYYYIRKCSYKKLSYERIDLIKIVLNKWYQLVFQNSTDTPYKYAIDNYFPD